MVDRRSGGAAETLLTVVYRDLDRQLDALHSALPQLPGDDGVGAVHRARIATRRLRGTLKAFREWLPQAPVRRFRTELSWLADLLGRVRDLDVHRARVADGLARLPAVASTDLQPYLRHVEHEHADRIRALEDALAGERFARLSADFARFLNRGPPRKPWRSAGLGTRERAAEYAVRALRKLRRAGRRLDRHAAPEALHRLRIRCRRLRFQLESFEPARAGNQRRVLRRLKRLQDSLGAHHDAIVSTQRLRAFAASADVPAPCRQALRDLTQVETAEAAASLRTFRRDWKRFEERVRPRKLRRRLR